MKRLVISSLAFSALLLNLQLAAADNYQLHNLEGKTITLNAQAIEKEQVENFPALIAHKPLRIEFLKVELSDDTKAWLNVRINGKPQRLAAFTRDDQKGEPTNVSFYLESPHASAPPKECSPMTSESVTLSFNTVEKLDLVGASVISRHTPDTCTTDNEVDYLELDVKIE
jgi:hypothetical protein